MFDCSDKEQVFLGVVSDTQWQVFCTSFDLHDLLEDPGLATNPERCHARDSFLPRVRGMIGGMTQAETMARCEEIGLPFAPIKRPQDLPSDPHLAESGGLATVTPPGAEPTLAPKLPVSLGDWRPGVWRDIPDVGEQSREIAALAGVSESEIDALLSEGVLSVPKALS